MKNQLSLIIALMFALVLTSEAQVAKKEIKDGFIEMQAAIAEKDFTKSIEYTADELFTLVPKDQMLVILETTFNNPQMEIVAGIPEVLSISEPEKEGEKFYAIIESEGIQKMRMFNQEGQPEPKGSEIVNSLQANFESVFGAENVSFDEKTNFFKINVIQKSVAISSDGKTGWKYLAIDKSQFAMLSQLLPEAIVAKLK